MAWLEIPANPRREESTRWNDCFGPKADRRLSAIKAPKRSYESCGSISRSLTVADIKRGTLCEYLRRLELSCRLAYPSV